jgi:hypothetical protein
MQMVRAEAPRSDAPDESQGSQSGALYYFVWFVYCMLFFGLIAGVLKSRFPIELGLFVFFTNNDLIAWAFRKVGIQLAPESLGANFIGAFVWVTGAAILLTRWKESAPAWLTANMPPDPPPWSYIAATAFACALLSTISTVFVRQLLPKVGIKIAPDSKTGTMIRGLVGVAILGLMLLLGFIMYGRQS